MTATVSRALLQETLRLIETHGTLTAAARAAGIPRTTMQARYAMAKERMPPEETAVPDGRDKVIEGLRDELASLRRQVATATKPKLTIRQDCGGSSEKIRVFAIGDAHDDRKIPKDRFEWLGKYARDTKPDVVLQIGDIATCDSLNSHIPNETLDGRLKPSFEADMGSLNLALQAFGCDGIEKHITLGNHERRIWLYEQTNPEMEGKLVCSLDSVLSNNGWTYSPYGAIHYYGGVGFVHAALNTLGKTYGGKNCLPTIANDSVTDLVIGHSHRGRVHQAPKIGQRYPTTIIDLGCALPDGHVEDYAKHALNGWTWGAYDLLIQHGHVQAAKFISMAELEERYAPA